MNTTRNILSRVTNYITPQTRKNTIAGSKHGNIVMSFNDEGNPIFETSANIYPYLNTRTNVRANYRRSMYPETRNKKTMKNVITKYGPINTEIRNIPEGRAETNALLKNLGFEKHRTLEEIANNKKEATRIYEENINRAKLAYNTKMKQLYEEYMQEIERLTVEEESVINTTLKQKKKQTFISLV
jgi:hypothetical protein